MFSPFGLCLLAKSLSLIVDGCRNSSFGLTKLGSITAISWMLGQSLFKVQQDLVSFTELSPKVILGFAFLAIGLPNYYGLDLTPPIRYWASQFAKGQQWKVLNSRLYFFNKISTLSNRMFDFLPMRPCC